MGTGGRGLGDRRRFRKSARADRSQAPARRRPGQYRAAAPRRRALGAGAPRTRSGVQAPEARAASSPINCCSAGECSFAICWRAKRWRRPGATCCPCCAARKRKAKSAAAVSSPDSWRAVRASRSAGPVARGAPQRSRCTPSSRKSKIPTPSIWPASSCPDHASARCCAAWFSAWFSAWRTPTRACRVHTRVNAWSVRFQPSVDMSVDAARRVRAPRRLNQLP